MKKKHKVFILAISDSTCDTCCKSEPMLDDVKKMFKNKQLAYKKKSIPIVRVDLNHMKDIIIKEDIKIDKAPKLVVYFEGKYFTYEDPYHMGMLLLFMNRLLFPVVIIKTEAQFNAFINTEKEWIENTPFFRGDQKPTLGEVFGRIEK